MSVDPRRQLLEDYSKQMREIAKLVKARAEASSFLDESTKLIKQNIPPNEVWLYDGYAYFVETMGGHLVRRKVTVID